MPGNQFIIVKTGNKEKETNTYLPFLSEPYLKVTKWRLGVVLFMEVFYLTYQERMTELEYYHIAIFAVN